MRHTQSVSAEPIPVASAFSNHQGGWKIFAAIIDALHHSRRLQAERIIRQYRHLLASSDPHDSKPNIGGR
jgi:hypothetical protein